MKSIVCEMCGSTNLMKTDGVFVCQYCGAKYSTEEAKKLMIDGTVDVKGKVEIDNTSFVEKFLQNARRAKSKEDWEETEKYYNLVEQNEPNNIEAIFYSSYAKAKTSLINSDIFKREATFKVLTNSVSIIDDNFNLEKEAEEKEIIMQISKDIIEMEKSQYVYTTTTTQYGTVDNRSKTITLFNTLGIEFCTSLNNIAEKYGEDRKKDTKYLYLLILEHYTYILLNGNLMNPTIVKQKAEEALNKLKEIDPSINIVIPDAIRTGGCYVATAVYGSYDCPEVWTLRRYRDNILAKTFGGRAFIYTYYAISPTIVKWFGNTEWFKKMWKGKLDKMVKELNEKGIEDTPYNDKKWQD